MVLRKEPWSHQCELGGRRKPPLLSALTQNVGHTLVVEGKVGNAGACPPGRRAAAELAEEARSLPVPVCAGVSV